MTVPETVVLPITPYPTIELCCQHLCRTRVVTLPDDFPRYQIQGEHLRRDAHHLNLGDREGGILFLSETPDASQGGVLTENLQGLK